MRKWVQKVLGGKYGRLLIFADMIALIAFLMGVGYCITNHQWILLSGIFIVFVAKCYFITTVIKGNYDTNFIKAMNNGSLICPRCHEETLEFHDHHDLGCEIICTNPHCDYSKDDSTSSAPKTNSLSTKNHKPSKHDKYGCNNCGWVYDDTSENKSFEELGKYFICPECGGEKVNFTKLN